MKTVLEEIGLLDRDLLLGPAIAFPVGGVTVSLSYYVLGGQAVGHLYAAGVYLALGAVFWALWWVLKKRAERAGV